MDFKNELKQIKTNTIWITEERVYQDYLNEYYEQIKNGIKQQVYKNKEIHHIQGKIKVESRIRDLRLNVYNRFEKKRTSMYSIQDCGARGGMLEVNAPIELKYETHKWAAYNLVTFELRDFGKRFVDDLSELASHDGVQLSFHPGYIKNHYRRDEKIMEFPDFQASHKEKLLEHLYPCLFVCYEMDI